MDKLVKSGTPRDRIFYFPFDDERIEVDDAGVADALLDAYYKMIPEARQGCYLFFDEIQEAPNWEAFVRRVSEQHEVTLVISGSSSKLLSVDIPTKLRGRSLSTEMWPLSFSEFCVFHDVAAPKREGVFTPAERAEYEKAFDQYLEIGGFPAVQNLGQTDRIRLLQTYADEIVTKDVLERFGTSSFRVGRRFARSALRSTGLKFSVNKQVSALRSAGLSLSNESAYALLDDFDDAHLVFKVSDYDLSIKDNPRSSYKLYAVDQGLSLAVAPASHLDLGQRLETAVFVELKRRYGDNRDDVICRYSTRACPEVDFVVGDVLLDDQYELIQVSADSGMTRPAGSDGISRNYKSEIGNLEKAMGETGLRESTLISLSEETQITTENGIVNVIPAWRWLLGNQ